MILNSIFLALEYKEFSQELKLRVKDQSRHITYYLQRKLKELRYKSNDFNRIVISLSEVYPEKVYINSELVASVTIKFHLNDLLNKTQLEIQDYYKSNIEKGLLLLDKNYTTPINEFFEWLKELKSINYKNEWTYKEKNFWPLGIKTTLKCSIDLERFNLSLLIEKNKNTIFNETILQTPPDDIAFYYKFKDLILDGDNLIVTSRIKGDKPFFELPLSKLT